MSFRDDGAAALEWAASYLERVRELPVLAQVEPGEIRRALPASPPETGEPFSAVLRDLDEVLLPGITHWQHPGFFAYFATTGSIFATLTRGRPGRRACCFRSQATRIRRGPSRTRSSVSARLGARGSRRSRC